VFFIVTIVVVVVFRHYYCCCRRLPLCGLGALLALCRHFEGALPKIFEDYPALSEVLS